VALIKSHTVDYPIHRLPLPIAVRARSVGFVYIYRHPLDVLLSSINYLVIRHLDRFLLNRRARSVEELKRTGELLTYLRLFEKDFTIGRNAFLRMCGANWLDHVNAHIARNGALPRQSMILTYEGLQEDPVAGAAPLKDLLGVSEGRLADAVQATSESTSADGRFFWKMTSRNFANYFPDDAIAEFLARHAEHLAPLGYTPD